MIAVQNRPRITLWLALFALIPITALLTSSSLRQESAPNTLRPYLEVQYYDSAVYQNAKMNSKPYPVTGHVSAGILPHHATASILISSFFRSLKQEDYDIVVVLAPNHKALSGGVVYADYDWLTPFGRVRNDDTLSHLISSSGEVQAIYDKDVVQRDHSASYLLPFVADYLPGKEVAVVLLSRTAAEEQVSALSEILLQYSKKKRILVLGSVDFSHFLMPEKSAQKDAATMDAVKNGKTKEILEMDNSYLDSPQTLACVMEYAQSMLLKLNIIDHSSSERELKTLPGAINPDEGTTTYLVYAAVNQ